MNYRPEIDGIRALAVLPVILFHAGVNAFSGGFVGVDIFFLVSGYLITTIILLELKSGTFTLLSFYERRARRILPALFLVVATCIPISWLLLAPDDMADFAASTRYLVAGLSNYYFFLTGGYFGSSAELKPLLHTWSLSVEEQYYLLFPLLLMFLHCKFPNLVLPALLLLTFSCFAFSAFQISYNPRAAFFLMPSRGWELLFGATLAVLIVRGHIVVKGNEPASLSGFLVILIAIFTFTDETPSPGPFLLLPAVGTTLLIVCATSETIVGRLLASRPFVSIGLISYSLYLWHHPLLAFLRHAHGGRQSPELVFSAVLLSFALAYLSWRFVEKPFRQRSRFSRHQILAVSLAGAISILFFGLGGWLSEGYAFRSPVDPEVAAKLRPNRGLHDKCIDFVGLPECRTSDEPEILVWGDSYAMHLIHGLLASNPNAKLIQATMPGCAPILDTAHIVSGSTDAERRKCVQHNRQVMSWLATSESITHVVVGSSFNVFSTRHPRLLLADGSTISSLNQAKRNFLTTLQTIKSQGKVPVVVTPPPKTGRDLGRCLLSAGAFGSNMSSCNFDLRDMRADQQLVQSVLHEIRRQGYRMIDLAKGLCSNGACQAAFGNTFIYRDSGHLSSEGSALLGTKMNWYLHIVGERIDAESLRSSAPP